MQYLPIKLKLVVNMLNYKIARAEGNLKAEHQALENISILRTALRVHEEQEANKILFNH